MKRGALVALVFVALCGILVLLLREKPPVTGIQNAEFIPDVPKTEHVLKSKHDVDPRPIQKIELPRPVVNVLAPPELKAPAPSGNTRLEKPPPAQLPGEPVDRREHVGPHVAEEREKLKYAFETLEKDVETCLNEWKSIEPTHSSQVMIGFELDVNGLTKSWVENADDVPLGPKTCLSNAVYGIDWSHVVERPAKLTMPFELGRDAGTGATP